MSTPVTYKRFISNSGLLVVSFLLIIGCNKWSTDFNQEGKIKNIALVIGNGGYLHTPPLGNPKNDAQDIGEALRIVEFDVIEGFDLDSEHMKEKLSKFYSSLEGAEVGLFFYAGHGLQVSGRNFLIPVDAKFDDDLVGLSGTLEEQAIELNEIVRVLGEKAKTSIVFLDACRDNPLTAELGKNAESRGVITVPRMNRRGRSIASAEIRRGLAELEAGSSMNMFIAYATQPGNIALDGIGRNSPFSDALKRFLVVPGLELRQVLTQVRKEVIAKTQNKQVPWDHASLTERFYFIKQMEAPPP